ncbi:hypothetical protein LZ578_08550 [Jeotgalibaca sp. MA1X17-3]|uniref:hypothetical protein n=1 Tax=Jeotgalibaca sp. MA1X17-3 TaxID=2908211 RepID=UPI001F2CF299|nr:hypothetical protein [Jeotgalibaca sp. MA1X17-3]UJF15048.1 hypothetical protein LZ578_08550 [Jeotgalibaca sp. MA1X17-3]
MEEQNETINIAISIKRENLLRLQNLALHYQTSPEAIINRLLEEHIRMVNTSVMETNKYNAFTRSFYRYTQDELKILGDSTYTEEDERLYKVFEALIDHAFDNKMLLSELYQVHKKA